VRSFGGDFGRVAIVESSAADASLIAAAPALLAALQGLLDPATNEDSVWYSEARQAARAAIARALGEAA
jgi:prenyltransferase beta subunit